MTTQPTDIFWRAMQTGDLPAVVMIASVVHPAYPEAPEVFAERLDLFAQSCWIASDRHGAAHGYAIAHPAMLGRPPALDTLLQRLPDAPDCLYLHDVAVTEAARQSGLGSGLIGLLAAVAQAAGITSLALTAVNNSTAYWQRRGFHRYEGADAALASKLFSYGEDAQYLVRDVAF